MNKREFQLAEPTIIDYDTSRLDHIDGSVTDIVPTQNSTYPNRVSFVPSIDYQSRIADVSPAESGMIGGVVGWAMNLVNSGNSGRTAQVDNADTLANAQLKTSAVIVGVCFLITAGLISVAAYILRAGFGVSYPFYTWIAGLLVIWGIVSYITIRDNYHQILHHSATGVEHHRIDAQGATARFAIDRAFDALERKWGVRNDK